MQFRSRLLSCCSLAALTTVALASAAMAADPRYAAPPPPPVFTRLPAVDGINGKAEIFGGASNFHNYDVRNFHNFTHPYATRNNWRGGGGGIGSLSAPLGHDFGVQVDAIVAPWNNRIATGGGAHLFWRDPAKGLVGVYGSGLYWSGAGGVFIGRAAGEGEAYFGPFTVKGLVGAEFGRRSSQASSAYGVTPFGAPYLAFDWYDTRTRFFDKVSLNYYALDNLKLSVGHIYTGGRHAATLGAEYLLPPTLGGGVVASAFVEGRVGERNAHAVMGGVRIYFGNSDKTLIRRHREDDPDTNLKDDLFTLSNSHRTGAVPLPLPTPACTPSPPDSIGPACGETPPPSDGSGPT
jgi:hypothetical protein